MSSWLYGTVGPGALYFFLALMGCLTLFVVGLCMWWREKTKS